VVKAKEKSYRSSWGMISKQKRQNNKTGSHVLGKIPVDQKKGGKE